MMNSSGTEDLTINVSSEFALSSEPDVAEEHQADTDCVQLLIEAWTRERLSPDLQPICSDLIGELFNLMETQVL
jgi:hypothetical protein